MDKINLISLRSSLGGRDQALDAISKNFLESISSFGQVSFTGKMGESGAFNVFFIESGGSELPFSKIVANYPSPYILLATASSNSLASSLEILSFLHQNGRQGEIVFGTPEKISARLSLLFEIHRARTFLSSARLMTVGKPSDWLIGSDISHDDVKKKFGVEFIRLPMEEFLSEERKVGYIKTKETERIGQLPFDEDVRAGAFDIYGALERLVKKEKLAGISIRCFDLLSALHNTSCLALSLLNEEGVVGTCEGDELSMLSMLLLKSLGFASFQANPSEISIEERKLILAHCTIPLNMIAKDNISLMTHFESGIGLAIRGKLPLGKVTLFKLSPDLKNYHLYVGNLIGNLERGDLCRSQVEIHFAEEIDGLVKNPYGNHLLLTLGDNSLLIKTLMESY